jgi:excisionase family DNA binding protein
MTGAIKTRSNQDQPQLAVVQPMLARSGEPLTATIADTVALTGLSRATIYRLAGSGTIRMIKVGRRTLLVWASVKAYLEGRPSANIRAAA